MSERSSKKKREHDFAITSFSVVQQATRETEPTAETAGPPQEPTPEERHEAAVKLGRLGRKKSGPARSAKLMAEQRREIAKKAARTSWHRDTRRPQDVALL